MIKSENPNKAQSEETIQGRTPAIRGGPNSVIRGGPNSEHFLSNLRKLLKRGKFFLTTQSLIVKRN